MKLLYVITQITENGGVQRVIFDKLNYLVENNSIDLIHLGSNLDTPSFYVDSRIRVHGLSLANKSSVKSKIENFIRSIKRFRYLVNSIKPDVIVNANTVLISWFLPFMYKKVPKIVELHQSYDGVIIFNRDAYGENSLRSKFLMLLRNIIYPLYDKVVVLTRTDQQKWGYKNCIVIPNFTNLEPRSIQSIDKNDFTFIWVGRICHQKGVDLLLDVWTQFCKIDNRCQLVVIGDGTGKYKQLLDKYLSESPYAGRLTYIPQTNNISEYYAQASAFISTSRFEGLPLVLVEAATMGLPIIGFNITGNDEVIMNGQNGYLIAPYDIHAFTGKMMLLSDNSNELQSMSVYSKEIAKRFSKKEVMDKWVNLFVSLIQTKENQ